MKNIAMIVLLLLVASLSLIGCTSVIEADVQASQMVTDEASGDDNGTMANTLQAALDQWRESNDIIGITLAVHKPALGQITLASGRSNIELDTAMKASDQLYAGSVTKIFVAVATLQLIDEGTLHFDDQLSQWYPDFPNANDISIHQLLNMTSGTFDYFRARPDNPIIPALMSDLDHVWTPEETISFVADLEPTAAPGEMYDYSNTNYIFLGRIIEEVTGNRLEDELQNRFFSPLEMANTRLANGTSHADNLAHGYARGTAFLFGSSGPIVDSTGRLTAIETLGWAAGSITANAGDMARFTHGLFDGNLLNEETLTQMVTPGPLQSDDTPPYGLGIEILNTAVGSAYGHPGSVPGGFTSLVLYVPEYKVTLVVMSNDEQAEPLLAGLADEVLMTVVEN